VHWLIDVLIVTADLFIYVYIMFVLLFVFLALQPTVVVFSQPGSGL